jgi:putative lipoic acid-binding regulatory protein
VIDTVAVHASFHHQDDVREQESGNGNFVSVTVTITAESKNQLDTIYQALHDHELVLMVL